MALADWTARVVWIPNAIRYNPPASPNVVKSWRATIAEIPECALKSDALATLASYCNGLGKAFAEAFHETFPEALPAMEGHPSRNQDQEQDQEQENVKAGATPRVPVQSASDNIRVITKLAHESLEQLGPQCAWSDLSEAVKCRCAELHIPYNSEVVRKALESAEVQRIRRGGRQGEDVMSRRVPLPSGGGKGDETTTHSAGGTSADSESLR
jgi:hypothetical protein